MSAAPHPVAPAVQMAGVTFSYGDRPALRGLDLEVPPGAIFGLLGPNGGGKSTTFRILSTAMPPATGQVRVLGLDPVATPDAVRRRLGVIFQDRSLDPKLTVRENLVHQGHLYGLAGTDLDARIAAGLDRFALTDRAGDRVETLSGGLARRVDLCKGTLHDPELLLLDEPSAGLDPAGRRELWELLESLRAEGTTVLVTTHLLEEAERCDRVAIVSRGRIVADGTPDALCGALGRDAIEVRTDDPTGLATELAPLGIDATARGQELRWHTDTGVEDLGQLLPRFRERVSSVRWGRPSLDDVFFARTGRHLDQDEDAREDDALDPAPATELPVVAAGEGRRVPGARAAVSLARRELLRFFRQRSRIVGTLATPAFFWILLGTGLGRSFQPPGYGDAGYLQFFYPGMLALTVLFTAIFSTISVIEDRHLGFLQSVMVAPVPRGAIVFGKILGGTALGLIQGSLLLPLAPLAGIGLSVGSVAAAVGVLATMGLALTGLGFVLAWRIDSTQGYHSAMNLLLVPMWLLSGSVFPATGNGAWVGWVMRANPLGYGLAALRDALGVPTPTGPSMTVSLLVMAGFGLAMFLVSVALVRRPTLPGAGPRKKP